MENVQLRVRIGNAWDGDPETKEFRNANFVEAVKALQGTQDEDGEVRAQSVVVIGTYVQGFTENLGTSTKPRPVERKTDQPIFGLEVTVYPPRRNYWNRDEVKYDPAQVNWGALGSSSPEFTLFYAQLMTTAAQLASAVNAAL